jgi:hypothetical protein
MGTQGNVRTRDAGHDELPPFYETGATAYCLRLRQRVVRKESWPRSSEAILRLGVRADSSHFWAKWPEIHASMKAELI